MIRTDIGVAIDDDVPLAAEKDKVIGGYIIVEIRAPGSEQDISANARIDASARGGYVNVTGGEDQVGIRNRVRSEDNVAAVAPGANARLQR